MPRIFLPQGCAGIADGNWKRFADKPGGHITLDDTDPVERRQLAKLAVQDYASAGLVDAGPEKFFTTRRDDGRWCPRPGCNFLANSWSLECPRCARQGIVTLTVPETDRPRTLPEGPYRP